MSKLAGWEDTIVALATPPGVGAIGVIRVSGTHAIQLVDELFPSKDLLVAPAPSLHVGLLKEGDKVIDEVVVSLFRTPKSYTGEDVVEISGHGSPFVLQQILEACIRNGARLARPGEFTQRAFLNGKMDLTQAEAVADLIASNTVASQKTALNAIRGGFSNKLRELRERLIKFSALIELELDFSQEDVEFADRRQFYALIEELEDTTLRLVDSFQLGNVIKNGVSVAIVGKPNAGKSTLLNVLLNENRAIVSDIPGTTRDTIEEVINMDGILFRLIDTAGIRQHTADIIETEGVNRSLQKMNQAGLVIYLFDVADEVQEVARQKQEMENQQLNFLMVGNKIDGFENYKEKFSYLENIIFIAAKHSRHIELLKEKMADSVLKNTVQTEDTVVTNARHYHALREVQHALADIRKGLDNNLSGDLLAPDIRRCLHYLGEIGGEVTNEDTLDYIFSKFCIGK